MIDQSGIVGPTEHGWHCEYLVPLRPEKHFKVTDRFPYTKHYLIGVST